MYYITESSQQPYEVGAIIIMTPILQVGKPRHGKIKKLAQSQRFLEAKLGFELR